MLRKLQLEYENSTLITAKLSKSTAKNLSLNTTPWTSNIPEPSKAEYDN